MNKLKTVIVIILLLFFLLLNVLTYDLLAKENNSNEINQSEIIENEDLLNEEENSNSAKKDETLNDNFDEEDKKENDEKDDETGNKNEVVDKDSNIEKAPNENKIIDSEKDKPSNENKVEENINEEKSDNKVENKVEKSDENIINNSVDSKKNTNTNVIFENQSNSNKTTTNTNNSKSKNTIENKTNTENKTNVENKNTTEDQNITNIKANATDIIVQESKVESPSVNYDVHIQNKGWMYNKKDSQTAGSVGESLRLEGIKLRVTGLDKNVSLKYQVHVQNIGWQDWKSNGQFAGTEGLALRLEAIKIRLESSEDYSIMYRTHVQNLGWQAWKSDGEISGTEGKGLRLEAIEIKIVKKIEKGNLCIESPASGTTIYNKNTVNVSGWKMSNLMNTYIKAYLDNNQIQDKQISYSKRSDLYNSVNGYGTAKENPSNGFKFSINTSSLKDGKHEIKIILYSAKNKVLKQTTTNFIVDNKIHINYSTHVQNYGWQAYSADGNTSGTEGQFLRIEAMKLNLYNAPNNGRVKYRAHVQNMGWQDWKSSDQIAGTEGLGLRVEALEIKLENMNNYTVEYQVHVEGSGWSGWHIDGETAGTVGESRRIEAIRVRIVPKYKRKYMGIDVSKYQGDINWEAVKYSGIDYVMIRVGYRGYAPEGNFAEDTKFVQNIEGAKNAGLKVGIYFVTQAVNEWEAVEEANWVIDKIRPYKIDMPVAIDVEASGSGNMTGRADGLDKNTRTFLVKRFCQTIQNAGYIPMIYLNIDWAQNYVDMNQLSDYDTWIAHYRNDPNLSPNYSGAYSMWQYTSSGIINGIFGNVDCNICYKNY